jgi:hypothetical protein
MQRFFRAASRGIFICRADKYLLLQPRLTSTFSQCRAARAENLTFYKIVLCIEVSKMPREPRGHSFCAANSLPRKELSIRAAFIFPRGFEQ